MTCEHSENIVIVVLVVVVGTSTVQVPHVVVIILGRTPPVATAAYAYLK